MALRKGKSTTFECQVSGTPEIRVTWYIDGNEVTDRAKYGISFVDGFAVCKVTDAKVEDSGTYVCEAHNDAGSESCSVELKVKGQFSAGFWLSFFGADLQFGSSFCGLPPY